MSHATLRVRRRGRNRRKTAGAPPRTSPNLAEPDPEADPEADLETGGSDKTAERLLGDAPPLLPTSKTAATAAATEQPGTARQRRRQRQKQAAARQRQRQRQAAARPAPPPTPPTTTTATATATATRAQQPGSQARRAAKPPPPPRSGVPPLAALTSRGGGTPIISSIISKEPRTPRTLGEKRPRNSLFYRVCERLGGSGDAAKTPDLRRTRPRTVPYRNATAAPFGAWDGPVPGLGHLRPETTPVLFCERKTVLGGRPKPPAGPPHDTSETANRRDRPETARPPAAPTTGQNLARYLGRRAPEGTGSSHAQHADSHREPGGRNDRNIINGIDNK